MSDPAVTVCIPSLPARNESLGRALASVARQTHRPADVIVELDGRRAGAAETRNRALQRVATPLVAFLDDDDELWPNHLALCVAQIVASGADVVYPWFHATGRENPLGATPHMFSADALRRENFIPVTVVARTEAVRQAGGFAADPANGIHHEDWGLWLRMLDRGATFSMLPIPTWTWHFGRHQTGGRAA